MDFIIDLLGELFGELFIWLPFICLLALIWAAGTFCVVQLLTNATTAALAALAAFLCGLFLTYLWNSGVKWARNTLLAGALLSLVPVAIYFLK